MILLFLMDFLVPHFVELKNWWKKICFPHLPPQATPRDLLSRIARALRRCFGTGSSGRFFGVPRHCAGRVARRRPGESQRQCGNSAGDVGHRNWNTWWTMGTHLPTLPWFLGSKPWFFMGLGSKESIPQCPKRPFTCHDCRVCKNSKLRSTRHHSCEVWMERDRKRHSCCQIVAGSGEIVTRLAKFRKSWLFTNTWWIFLYWSCCQVSGSSFHHPNLVFRGIFG